MGLSFFKAKKDSKDRDSSYSARKDIWNTGNKVYTSVEDNILVAEPDVESDVDEIASAFILNFHISRDSEDIQHHQAG